MARFIWGGRREKRCMYLARWDSIAIPKEKGGWGIKDMEIFGKSLLTKSLWRCLNSKGKWQDIIKGKYLGQ